MIMDPVTRDVVHILAVIWVLVGLVLAHEKDRLIGKRGPGDE